ncbi:MAG: 30S ribosomal protein S8e [Candidatus Anstonellales archaeon]
MRQYHKKHSKTSKPSDKKLSAIGGEPANAKVGDKKKAKTIRVKGGNFKRKIKVADFANVLTKEGKMQKVRIKGVVEGNTSEFTRENIITKGAIINTEIGKAIVTSRPGQHGVINAKQI